MGGLPISDKASVPDYASQISALDTDIAKNREDIRKGFEAAGELAGLETAAKTESQKAKLAEEERGLQQYRTTIADSEVAKQLDRAIEQRNKPFVPTQESSKDLMNVFTLTTLVGFALGGAGKAHAQQAVSAMNGMLEGHIKGREDLYKREKDIFDENSKALDRLVTTLQAKKQEVLELAKTDYQAAQVRAEQLAIEAGAPFAADIARKQGVVKWGEYIDTVNRQLEKQKESLMRLNEQAERRKETERAHAETVRHNLQEEQIQSQRLGYTQAQGERKIAKDEAPLIQGVRGIEDLQRQLRDPEVRTGWIAATAPFTEKFSSIDFTADPGDVVRQVNSKLTATDKTTLFLKDAILRAYEIERAARGGGRLTVQDVRILGPVLNPVNYTPDTYNQLLETRRRTLYENLQDMGVPRDEIEQRTKLRPYTPFGDRSAAPASVAPSSTAPSATTKNSEAELRAYDAIKLGKNPSQVKAKFKELYGYDLP